MRRPIWCAAFLRLLESPEMEGNVSVCAHRAGRYPCQVYRRRKVDARFAADMDAALALAELRLTEAVTGRRIA